MKYILTSFCNLPKFTKAPLACVQLEDDESLLPINYAPVSISFPGLVTGATGITQFQDHIFILFASIENYYVSILDKETLKPLGCFEVPEVKDGHSILAHKNCLYIASSGTDEILCYDIAGNQIQNPRVIWQASDEKRDTHHVNSIAQINGELIVSAFGPKEGKLWSTAKRGYIYNLTRDEMIKEDIYHPHSLSVRGGKIYYTESQANTLCSVDEGALIDLNGYTRGVAWLSDDLVCIASSIGRKISRSTKLVANPGDPGEPAGECGLFIGSIRERRIIAHIDMSHFGPEIYDALVLENPSLNLLQLANLSHLDEREALQDLHNRVVAQEQQLSTLHYHVKSGEQRIAELNAKVAEREAQVETLGSQLSEQEKRVQLLHSQVIESEKQVYILTAQVNEQSKTLRALQSQIEASKSFGKRSIGILLGLPKTALTFLFERSKASLGRFIAIPIFRRLRHRLHLKANLELIQTSFYFDAKWYLEHNPDVARAGIDPARHYLLYGGFEGRDPSPYFSSKGYLDAYPDVQRTGVNPLIHYLRFGKGEGRLPKDQPPAHQSKRPISLTLRYYLQAAYFTLRQDGLGALVNKTVQKMRHPAHHWRQETHPKAHAASTAHQETYLMMLDASRGKPGEEFVPLSEDDLSAVSSPVKLLAFYLPQYHPIPENDLWWGKGFTEWTNVSKAIPLFPGHYQPHLPGELGFYDLRVPQVQRRQVELAKKYGIYGFCFYYYWFNGKTLLDYPLKQFINDPEINFPFCLCWANENWTRRWDGMDHEILIAQNHSEDSDLGFIQDIAPYLMDKRYIRIEDRPLLVVYRVNMLENPAKTARQWREFALAEGLGNPFLVAAQVFGYRDDPQKLGFDAAIEFPPNTLPVTDITHQFNILNPSFGGHIYDYQELVTLMTDYDPQGYKIFKGVMPSWDNTARQPDRPSIFINATPQKYEDWLTSVILQTIRNKPPEERYVFINAWNEWAEGNHLEPDRKYGYAYLQATANALKRSQARESDWNILFVSHDAQPAGAQLVLLNIMRWFAEHTHIGVRLLCLNGGSLLPEFEKVAPTLQYAEIANLSPEERLHHLEAFCQGKPDLIYANSVASGRVFSWMSQWETPILTHVHELNMSIQRYASEWMGSVIEHSNGFIACSETVRTFLIAQYGVDPQKCITVHTFIEPSGVAPLGNKGKIALRKKLGLDEDQFIVFGCGVGMPFRKGADLFIETAERLLDLGEDKFHYYWLGEFDQNESDPQYGSWAKHTARLNDPRLKTHVTFLGFQPAPQQFMLAGDVFLLTSREEPLGRVALEAAECGLPIICFEGSGGALEFINHDTGIVVPSENTRAMAEKIRSLMHNPGTGSQLGENARQRLLEEFTLDHSAPKVLSATRKTAGKPPKVSIILPNYNHAPYLPARLESIFNQTYQDFEVILMDDASTDNSLEVFERYAHRGDVQIIRNQENSGSPFAQWLKAFDLVKGDILWIAESDDLCENNFLEQLLPAFQDPEVKLAYCASNIIDDEGTVVGNYPESEYLRSISPTRWLHDYCVPAEEEINQAFGIKNTILNISAALFRKPQLDGRFKNTLEKMHIAGDTYLLLHIMSSGKVYYKARILNYHRRHRQSIVGKVLAERGDGHLRGFYEDMTIIYTYIAKHFQLKPEFPGNLERYLEELWQTLAPGRPFEELESYFPYGEIMGKIRQNARKQVSLRTPKRLSDEDVAKLLEDYKEVREAQAKKWGVSPEIHVQDLLFRFVHNHPNFAGRLDQAIEYYFSDGHNSAEKLRHILITKCGYDERQKVRLLEFASGFGGVTRHIPIVIPYADVVASDIHAQAINFIKNILKIPAVISTSRPEEFVTSEKFDVVFALSFFSHMPKNTFSDWLSKLASLLNPNGYLIFTTHGKISTKHFQKFDFDEDGFYFKPEGDQFDLNPLEYGLTCTLPRFVIKQIFNNPDLSLDFFQEGYWWEHQDLYVVRKSHL